jgi:hypothetical protein
MEFCCTCSSCVLWRTVCALDGGPPLAPISVKCRCFSPSVFALLPLNFGTLATSKFTVILDPFLYQSHQISGRFNFKLADVENPLSYAARQVSTLTELWPGSPVAEKSGSTTCPGYHQKAVMSTYWIVPNWHFSNTLTEFLYLLFPSVVRQMPGYNTQNQATDSQFFHVRPLKFSAIILSLTLKMTIPGWYPRKPSSQSYAPA